MLWKITAIQSIAIFALLVNRTRGNSVKFVALLTFSLLISEDFWVFLSFLSDRSVLYLPTNVLKALRSLGKSRRRQKPSQKPLLISKEKVNKVVLCDSKSRLHCTLKSL